MYTVRVGDISYCDNIKVYSTLIEYVHSKWFVSTSIELVHEERVNSSNYRQDSCSTDVKCYISTIEEFPEVCDACIWYIK